ncbi:siderophore biosynthesis protein [Mycobacterium sp. E3251]|uniref:GNAT family N-acetyltransferase n=1 Tax=unclassified Mycobacterium TaxID=2642494 RepID=UPI0007FD9293|nr:MULTISPECIES: GNAT family N-acetyltransferase [unclassified Mycobacterium]OBG90918.1 siderophore biosynthesis protein [Mycobacterium sp. E3251]OBI24654.1 siderophore biosynthesis protein [Mycobacterium sp. E2238]OBI39114.1 siderophore biosynthesis protein [Mycobacterium sp. E1386]
MASEAPPETQSAQVLPRERFDIADELARIGPPPLPALEPPFALRVARRGDAGMVSEWMNRPHLAAAWEYDWPTPRWERHLGAQLDGTYSLPLLGSIRGNDCAYLELYWSAKDLISYYYEAEPHDLGLHAAIADPALVNRGLGPMLLPRIVASAFAMEPRCRRIMFDPDHRNTAARRLCENAGCTFLGEHDARNRRMSLYALQRPATDA